MVLLNPQQPEQKEDAVMMVVRWTEAGSAIFEVKFTNGVTPTMLLGLSGYLEMMAKADLMEMREASKVHAARLNPNIGNLTGG